MKRGIAKSGLLVAKKPDWRQYFSVLSVDQLWQNHLECFKSQSYVDFTSKSIELESLELGKACLQQTIQVIYRHGIVENLYIEMKEHG